MTLRQRLANVAPVWAFACRKAREAAQLTARVRELEHELVVARADVRRLRAAAEGWRAHHEVASRQRREALDAILPTLELNDDDEAWLRSLGERPA